MCNQPREAQGVYRRMLEGGHAPNSTTYNALISAYGKAGQLDKVMEVFQVREGVGIGGSGACVEAGGLREARVAGGVRCCWRQAPARRAAASPVCLEAGPLRRC